MITETITINGAAVEVMGEDGYAPVISIKITKDGKTILEGLYCQVCVKLRPETQEQLKPVINRVKLAVRGRTEESEAARLAGLAEYDRSNAATKRAMSI